jgi:hypothetical protein
MKHLAYYFAILVSISLTAYAEINDPDLHLKVQTKLITKAFNQAMGHFVDSQGYIKRSIPSQTYDLKLKLSDYMDVADPHYYGEKLLGLSLKGESKINLLFENPYAQAKIKLYDPIIKSQNAQGDVLNIELNVDIINYLLAFEHVWMNESGLTNATKVDENSCHNTILNGTHNDKDLVAQYQSKIAKFYKAVDSKQLKKISKHIWARLDNFSIGWSPRAQYKDNRNILKIKLVGTVDLRAGQQTLKIKTITHNLGKKGGAQLAINLEEKNIIFPPIFIKSNYQVVDESGLVVKNEDGSDQLAVRCTPVDVNFIKSYVLGYKKDMAKQVYNLLTDDLTNGMIANVNKQISMMAQPEIPYYLMITNGDDAYETKEYFGITYKVPKTVEMSFYDDVAKIFGDFYSYRASLGLHSITTPQDGSAVETRIKADFILDGNKLVYRENSKSPQFKGASNFTFSNLGQDASFAVSGKMLQKVINLMRDRLIQTHTPYNLNVFMNNDSYNVENGWVVFAPKIEVDFKDYEIIRFSLKVRVKPEIVKDSYGATFVKIKYDIPDTAKIVAAIKPGAVVKVATTALDLLFPILTPVRVFYVEPKIKEKLAEVINEYVSNVKNNYAQYDISSFVNDSGVQPTDIKFHSTGHAAIYVKLNKIIGLDDAALQLKEKLGL